MRSTTSPHAGTYSFPTKIAWRGIKLDFDDPVAYVRNFGSKISNARPSMLLDHMAGRMSEIEAINGAIPVAAKSAGIAAPCNEVISALVRAKERRIGAKK